MALRESKMIRVVDSAALLTLTPDTGESIRVTNIMIIPNVAVTEFATVQINRQTVGFFHVGSTRLNQLPWITEDEQAQTIMSFLQGKGIPMFFPVAEGETFRLTTPNNWTLAMVEYEIYDASDIKSTDVNGSNSAEYYFLNYGTNSANITADGYLVLDANHNPVEFPDFPFGNLVPSNTSVDILGIGMPDVTRTGANPAADYRSTSRLRLFRDRKVLFDEDRLGFPVTGTTAGAAANTTYYRLGTSMLPYGGSGTFQGIKLFPEPLSFKAGDELAVQVSFISGGAFGTIQANDLFVCLPMHVKQG